MGRTVAERATGPSGACACPRPDAVPPGGPHAGERPNLAFEHAISRADEATRDPSGGRRATRLSGCSRIIGRSMRHSGRVAKRSRRIAGAGWPPPSETSMSIQTTRGGALHFGYIRTNVPRLVSADILIRVTWAP